MLSFKLATLFTLLSLTAMLVGCGQSNSYEDFRAKSWDVSCADDADCELLYIPCDHCGAQRSIARRQSAEYRNRARDVSCEHLPHEQVDCGSPVPMVAVCRAGSCASEPRIQ